MPEKAPSQSALILHQTEDGRTRIQCRFEQESVWMTQALLAPATIRKFRTVRFEGARQVTREIEHSNLEAIP